MYRLRRKIQVLFVKSDDKIEMSFIYQMFLLEPEYLI